MTTKKKEPFTESHHQIAELAKALGHPARVAIIEYLQKSKACYCGNIVDELPLAQATVSQHLKVLKQASLIKGDIEGNAICYCIDEEGFGKLKEYIDIFTQNINDSNICK